MDQEESINRMALCRVSPRSDSSVPSAGHEQSWKLLSNDRGSLFDRESTASSYHVSSDIATESPVPALENRGNSNAASAGFVQPGRVDDLVWDSCPCNEHLDKIFLEAQASLTEAVATKLFVLKRQVLRTMKCSPPQTFAMPKEQFAARVGGKSSSAIRASEPVEQVSGEFLRSYPPKQPFSKLQMSPVSSLSAMSANSPKGARVPNSTNNDDTNASELDTRKDGLVQKPKVAKFKCPGEDKKIVDKAPDNSSQDFGSKGLHNTKFHRVLEVPHETSNDMTMVLMQLNSGNAEFVLQNCFNLWASMRKPLNFNLLSFWDDERPGVKMVKHLTAVGFKSSGSTAEKQRDFGSLRNPLSKQHCCQRFIMCPSGTKRAIWDCLGTFLLFWDILVIPFESFHSDRSTFMSTVETLILIYWSCDMIASCLTGFVDKGNTIMDPHRIVITYIRSWLTLDLVTVVPDWILKIRSSDTSAPLRVLRTFRMARLLRLAKLSRVVSMIRDRIDSEYMFILVNIVKLIFMLLMVNHFLACIWYFIGTRCEESNLESWIVQAPQVIKFTSPWYKYATALHWSLTQFTPASMSVQPQNVYERFFAIAVLVFGLVLFSSFVSNITASMTQLRTMQDDKSKQFWLLRRYLRQNRVQPQLTFRVLRFVEYACNETEDRVSESRIHVLNLLSEQLREELHYEVAFSRILAHPLMERISIVSRETMHALTKDALQQRSLATEDTLFHVGSQATQMHIVESGRLLYRKAEDDNEVIAARNDWFCEPSLWTSWRHLGEAKALVESRIISLDAVAFGDVVATDVMAWEAASFYAESYVRMLCTTPRCNLVDVSRHSDMHHVLMEFLADDSASRGSLPRLQSRVLPLSARNRFASLVLPGNAA